MFGKPKNKGSYPTHRVVVFDQGGYGTEVGAAWPTKDGTGLTVVLKDGIGLGGKFSILSAVDREKKRGKDAEGAQPEEAPIEVYGEVEDQEGMPY